MNAMELFRTSSSKIVLENGQNLDFSQVLEEADSLSGHIPERSLVLCLVENDYPSLLAYISFVYGKNVPILLSSETAQERVKNIIEEYQPEYLWLPLDKANLVSFGEQIYTKDGYVLFKRNVSSAVDLNPDLCLLVSTSGSTGSPKFVRQSYKNVVENTRSIVEYLSLTEADSAITSLPIHYTFGMSLINCQIASSGTLVLTGYSYVQKEFWAAVREEEVSVLAGVPYTYQSLDRLRFFRKDTPSIKKLLQAGGKLPESLQEKMAGYTEQYNKEFFVMYGQTEATTRMSYLPPNKFSEKIGSIGVPIPRGKLRIVDSNGENITTSGEIGELIYEGTNVCLGYATKAADLFLGDEWQGVLRTGDLACFDEDDFFYIKGRIKRIVKAYGLRVNLDEVEGLLKHKFPQLNIACIDQDEQILCCSDSVLDEEGIRDFISQNTQVRADGVSFKHCAQIPKLANGKVDYQGLKGNIHS